MNDRGPFNSAAARSRVAALFLAAAGALHSAPVTAQVATTSQASKDAPITADEADAFVESLAQASLKGDVEASFRLVDWDRIVDKALEVPELPGLAAIRRQFKQGVILQLKRNGGLTTKINATIKQGGSYRALRVDVEADPPTVMFRLKQTKADALNYHRFLLARNAAGEVVADDFYVFLSGEKMSETLRRTWLPIARQSVKSEVEKRTTPVEPWVASLDAIDQIHKMLMQDRHAEVLDTYRKLPEAVRKDKAVLLLRMTAAQAVSEEEYRKSLEDMRTYLPNDPATDFLSIDGYALQKQYDEAVKCLDRTNEQVRDPLLLARRASLLLLAKNVAEARKSVQEAIRGEPDLSDGYTVALDVALADQNHDETAAFLDILNKTFGYKWKDLRTVPIFAEFVKSPQYAAWAETQSP
jgi:predicted negative regulator of RcsB-dependent stress response